MYIQGWAKLPFPGCENAAGQLRQKRSATARTKFTKPGNKTLADPCRGEGGKPNSHPDNDLGCRHLIPQYNNHLQSHEGSSSVTLKLKLSLKLVLLLGYSY